MKIDKILLTTFTLLAFSQTIEASAEGEKLFLEKCSTCHSTTRPVDMSKVIAPALMGVMRHLKMEYPKRRDAIAFIKDFVINPTKEKAICMPQKLKRFGLMPSQKGVVTDKELEVISGWMFDNFPPKDFKGMRHGKNRRDSMKQSLFLISSLPHLTKTIQKNWDDFDFDLSDKQQDKLRKVRQDTMKKIGIIKPKIKKLIEEIELLTKKDEKVEKIMPLVKEVAILKAKATEVQLLCLSKTKEILTKKQLDFLSKK